MKQYLSSNYFIPSVTDLGTALSSLSPNGEGFPFMVLVLLNASKTRQYLFDVLLLPVIWSVQKQTKKRKHSC